jgi:hypothetical protein
MHDAWLAFSSKVPNFASLQLLFAFLLDEISEAPDSDAATPDNRL